MPSSSVTKQAEEILEEVLRTIREEYERPCPLLCESDRNRFVEEEGSLREQLKKTIEPEPKSFRGLFGLPSPQAAKCLKDAEELRQRVKEAIRNAKLTRIDGPPTEGNPEPASTIITTSLNKRRSPSEPEVSDVNLNPAVKNNHDYTSDINEAISSPLEMSSESSDRRRDSSSRPHRRSPPPPPLVVSPHNKRHFLSEPEASPLKTSSEASDRRRDSSSRPHRRSPPPPPLVVSPHNKRHFLSEHEVSPLETSSEAGDRSCDSSGRPRRRSPPPPPLVASPHNIRLFLSEPEVSPLETSSESSDRSCDTPSRRRRGSPPPPRRMSQSGNSRLLSDTSSNSGGDTPRRSDSVRRPAPPPPQSPRQSRTPRSPINISFSSPPQSPRQSRTPRSPINVSFPSPGTLPDPAMISSLCSLAEQLKTLAPSIIAESRSGQAKGQQRPGSSVDYVTKTNCVDITGSNVKGLTLNTGGHNNSGAVIHKVMAPPQRSSRHAPQF